jgi:hypothetical protein
MEFDVHRSNDDTHTTNAEDAINPVLSGEDIAYANQRPLLCAFIHDGRSSPQ